MITRTRLAYTEPKTGRIQEAMKRYGLGRDTLKKVAARSGASIKIGKAYLINFDILDRYMDELSGRDVKNEST